MGKDSRLGRSRHNISQPPSHIREGAHPQLLAVARHESSLQYVSANGKSSLQNAWTPSEAFQPVGMGGPKVFGVRRWTTTPEKSRGSTSYRAGEWVSE